MNRFKSFVMVVASLVVSLSAVAQSDLSWSAAVEMQTASKGVVVVDARPSMGYHFYAFAPEGGYNSTQLEIVAQEGVEVLGAPQASVAPTKVFEESFGEFVSHWASNVKFTIPFQINDGKNHNLTIRMWWQSCTDQQRCLPFQFIKHVCCVFCMVKSHHPFLFSSFIFMVPQSCRYYGVSKQRKETLLKVEKGNQLHSQ